MTRRGPSEASPISSASDDEPDSSWSRERLVEELRLLRHHLRASLRDPGPETGAGGAGDRQPLETVQVPEEVSAPFVDAHRYVERYFESLVHHPAEATISIAGERYVLLRAASMSVEFIDLVTSLYGGQGPDEAWRVANNLLFDLAHALGKADARSFHDKMGVTDPIAKLSAGPIHFAFSGWAFVEILPESKPSPDDDYFLVYDHPYSFESHSWIAKGKSSDRPVCIMNAGYSSGWCEESFDIPLVAVEIECTAAGGDRCRFIMAPPNRIDRHLEHFGLTPARGEERHEDGTAIVVPEFFERRRLEEQLRRANEDLERRVAERTAELTEATERLRLLGSAVENALEGIVIMSLLDDDGRLRIDSVNEGFRRVSGLSDDELVGRSLDVLDLADDDRDQLEVLRGQVASGDPHQSEITVERPDGSEYALEIHVMPVESEGGRARHWIGIFRDVTARRRHLAELRHQAMYDSLTELPNRALLYDRLEQEILRATRTGDPMGLLVMDLDGFKEVNDTFGHHVGDVLLQQIGPRLRAELRSSDTVARLGGDEFAIVLPAIRDRHEVTRLAKGLLKALHLPFTAEGQTFLVGASVGIVLCPEHGADVSTLLRRADVAMYVAKDANRGLQLYRPEIDTYSPERLALVGELRDGIEGDELLLHYQPQIDLATGRTVRLEALVRWRHPRRGLLEPHRFVPLAEPGSLIDNLTEWVLDRALRQCSEWSAAGFDVGVSVNLAPRSLRSLELTELVGRLLEDYRVAPERLTLEMTERGLLGAPGTVLPSFERLRDLGVRLSIDDFGTGYASLTHLRKLPIHEIKVDRSFVRAMATNDQDAAIVRSTIQLAKNLGRELVAEGIEDPVARDLLADQGCDLGQGHLIARPMAAAAVPAWLDDGPRS